MRQSDYYVSELEFEDGGMRGMKGESGDAPSLYISKVAPFLYQTEIKSYEYNKAEIFVRMHYVDGGGACATVRKGGVFGYNHDGRYDDTAEFVVRTPARKGVHASIGMAAIPGVLTTSMVDAKNETQLTTDAYDVLPFFMTDGLNDAGVMVSMHRMPGDVDSTPGDDSGMCALFAVRYILDNASSVQESADLISAKEFWCPENELVLANYALFISDNSQSIIAYLDGREPIQLNERDAFITNFTDPLEKYARGIERYSLIENGFGDADGENDIANLLKSVWYTGIYNADNAWYSDYNGDWTDLGFGELTVNSTEEDYLPIMQYFAEAYAERTRDGATQLTTHTSVYNIARGTLDVYAQETDEAHRFCMDETRLIQDVQEDLETLRAHTDSEITRVHDELQEEIDEIPDNYYNKTEVDASLSDLHDVINNEVADGLAEKMDNPTGNATVGQVIYKTAEGSAWGNLPIQLPSVTETDNGKVLVVTNGAWEASDQFADYIRYVNITVTITSDTGAMPSGGIEVLIRNGDMMDVINRASYNGQPVTFRVPRGLNYVIEQTGKWEGFHNPTPARIEGAATNDTTCVFTYEAIKVPETLRELQIIVDGGGASSLKSHVGLQFEDVYDDGLNEYNIVWDLKDVKVVYDQDNNPHYGVILQWHKCTPFSMPFDAPERVEVDLNTETTAQDGMYYYGLTGSTIRLLTLAAGDPLPTTYDALYKNEIRSADGNVIRRGYGRYSDSAVRKWLNSAAPAGSWFAPSHVGDAAPNQSETVNGFMAGCSSQIMSMVKPVRVRCAISDNAYSDTYDKFFLPSVDAVNGVFNGATEGEPWQEWVDAMSGANATNNANTARRIYPINGTGAQDVGLRSANIAYQYITWNIKSDGAIDGYPNASAERRYTPCCAIY